MSKHLLLSMMTLLFLSCSENIPVQDPTNNTVINYPSGILTYYSIEAPSITNGIFGEEINRSIGVYLPPNYQSNSNALPVFYFLAGFEDKYTALINWLKVKAVMDELIGNSTIDPMIVVILDGYNKTRGSFYVNSPITGNWEDYVVHDVVNFIDSNFNTLTNPESRGIAGHSMGGYGALNIAMHHPEIFRVVYAMSPGLFNENGLSNCQMNNNNVNINYYGMANSVTNLPQSEAVSNMLLQINTMFSSMSTYDTAFSIAYGLAFAPNFTNGPPFMDFIYDENGVGGYIIDTNAWSKFNSGFGGVSNEAIVYHDNWLLLKVKVDYGTLDYYPWIINGCKYFKTVMSNENIPVEVESYYGDHQNKISERFKSQVIPFFNQYLQK